jgi:exodeoxyribonuclease V alpha subunit
MPGAPKTSTPTELLAGLVERVTFHNDENGFCVLRFKALGQRDLITVLGHAAMISAGELVQASGGWVNERTHGVQFKPSFSRQRPRRRLRGSRNISGPG